MIFHLPTPITVLIDIVAWLAIHMGVSYLLTRRPLASFSADGWLCRQRGWENDGKTYQGIFRLKSWKKRLPDGALLFKSGFQKKKLKDTSREYLEAFVAETCRAELTHWIVFLFGFVFLVWNIWWVGIVMVVYAMAANVPCIVTQRYNRIRLRRIVKRQAAGI